jgi:hypothetical protein
MMLMLSPPRSLPLYIYISFMIFIDAAHLRRLMSSMLRAATAFTFPPRCRAAHAFDARRLRRDVLPAQRVFLALPAAEARDDNHNMSAALAPEDISRQQRCSPAADAHYFDAFMPCRRLPTPPARCRHSPAMTYLSLLLMFCIAARYDRRDVFSLLLYHYLLSAIFHAVFH